MVRRFVSSKSSGIEEALAHWGLLRKKKQKKNKNKIIYKTIN
jgi:hypothetical protein